tara:strand:- start:4441 stop:6645 length:2205 start_codon:yes stop_codon:yes gene_type:complete
MNSLPNLSPQFRALNGPLTEQLVREPGLFGLGQHQSGQVPDASANTVCGYCSTGCSLYVDLFEGQAVSLSPNIDYPVNRGMACPKGWEALAPLAAPDRAATPYYRLNRSDELKPVDWKIAAGVFCDRMREVQHRFGPESIAFLSSGQICTEEMALLGAFAKFEMGMIHGDGNSPQGMASSARAYRESFGFDAPPYTFSDLEKSDVIVLIGSNLCLTHPILWQRVQNNPRSPKIIVIDPRRTETATQATQHVGLLPKSDLTLFYGIAHLLIKNDWVDHDFVAKFTNGFDDFASHVQKFTPELVTKATGLTISELELLAETIGKGESVSLWWTMGVNQSYEGTRTVQAIINIALMTGNMGRRGTGANSISGQANAMGSRLFSNTSTLLGGHDFTNSAHREKVADVLGIESYQIPDEPGWSYDQILDGIESGAIRALWIIGNNVGHSWANQLRLRELFSKLEFLVVQDMYTHTETAGMADLILPAAGWGEKDGTMINSERRIGVTRKVSRAPGQALSDFKIFRLLAATWGAGDWLSRWKSPEDAFATLQELTEDQPCDISGIRGYEEIEEAGGIQWPWPEPQSHHKVQRRLFEDGKFFTEDRRARFIFDEVQENPEPPDENYPYTLLTGRGSSTQWQTQTRTKKSSILRRFHPDRAYIEISRFDAKCLNLWEGDRARVKSRRGEMEVDVFTTSSLQPGQVFIPFHYPETNRLTLGSLDPHSRQPSYKYCSVQIEAMD